MSKIIYLSSLYDIKSNNLESINTYIQIIIIIIIIIVIIIILLLLLLLNIYM